VTGPAPESRRGRLLVAAPAMADPSFRRTVVLMLEHSPEGARGLVLNRPTPRGAREALPRGLAEALPQAERVYEGGPVQPEAVIVLAEFAHPSRAASIAFDNVGVVDPQHPVETLGGEVRSIRAFGGYAGWAGGQLEQEIAEEAWIDSESRREDVFTDAPERLWSGVLERKGGAWRLVARMPDDPTRN
jgi:putative transcriptional regulator